MSITDKEELIININGRTNCYTKEDLKQALGEVKTKETFCAQYNRDNEKLAKEENRIEPNYYMKYKIIPLDFILANNIPFVEANVIKYVCRWKDKNGVEDLKKAVSYLEKLIKHEENEVK